MAKKYWLFKSEPDDFSIDDLEKSKNQTTFWSGVRNYQARNYLRDEIKKGDGVFFYQSNTDPAAIVGLCSVVKDGYADTTQFNPEDSHYYPSASEDNPVWYMVDIKLNKRLAKPVTLAEIKSNPKLQSMKLVQRGNRLSVMPVSKSEWDVILKMSGEKL